MATDALLTLTAYFAGLGIDATTLPVSPSVMVGWLEKTAQLESHGKLEAVGDKGKSRGPFQIQEKTWKAYSHRPWRTYAHDRREATRVATGILSDCYRACLRDKKEPSFKNVRWYYRHGGF